MAKNISKVRGQTPNAKSLPGLTEVLRETTKLWRKHHLSYDQSRNWLRVLSIDRTF
jgi:hypothetical protein